MLTPLAGRDGAGLRGRWLRFAWSQSLAGQPARPVIQFVRAFGSEEHVLPAAVLGRGAWTWRAPRDLERLEILVPDGMVAAFRVDALGPVPTPAILAGVLRRSPRALPHVLWWRGSDRARSVPAHEAQDLARPDEILRLLGPRGRPLEPDGLDAPLFAAAPRGPRLDFLLAIEGRSDVEALRRTLASFAAQVDRGFRLYLHGPGELPLPVPEGLADRIVRSETGSRPDDAPGQPEAPAPYVARLLPGDEARPEAVLMLRAHLADHPSLDALYADDLVRDPAGLRARLKPDWSPLLQRGRAYVGRPCLVRGAPVDGDPPDEVLARIAERPDAAIGHLKRILFTLGPTEDEARPLAAAPRSDVAHATLIVPTRDRADLLRRLVDSLGGTKGFDLVVVDNGSEDEDARALLATLEERDDTHVLRRPGPFNFSRLVNAGAEAAQGDVLVLLNNDCEVVAPDWLPRLVSLAMEPGIGAVGAKLLFADRTLQHAGVALGLGGEAGHRDRRMPENHPGHLGRLLVPHEVAAVTGACLAVRRATFLDAGGFDEDLPVAFNDIDFCLRLLSRGLRNVVEPAAVLLHAESASRGRDEGPRRARFLAEAAVFRDRWRSLVLDDPYLHPMFSTVRFADRLG